MEECWAARDSGTNTGASYGHAGTYPDANAGASYGHAGTYPGAYTDT